jgi:hypothetical protein
MQRARVKQICAMRELLGDSKEWSIGLQPDAMINVQLAAKFYAEEGNEAG